MNVNNIPRDLKWGADMSKALFSEAPGNTWNVKNKFCNWQTLLDSQQRTIGKQPKEWAIAKDCEKGDSGPKMESLMLNPTKIWYLI